MTKTYAYTAKGRDGKGFSNTIQAEDVRSVVDTIAARGHFVTSIKEVKPSTTFDLPFINNVDTQDLSIFCWQFTTMISAGMSLVSTLNTLLEQATKKRMKSALTEIIQSVQGGDSISMAMGRHPTVFPKLMISMIEAGELSGELDKVLARLAKQFEKDHNINEKIKSAMTYPVVVGVMAFIVVFFIFSFVLPIFKQMFDGLNAELPAITTVLLNFSVFSQEYWQGIILGVIAFIYFSYKFYQIPQVHRHVEPWVLRLPIFGNLIKIIAIARFTRAFSSLLTGGVPMIAALDVVKKVTNNMTMMEALEAAKKSVSEGQGLSQPLNSSQIFTPMVIKMIAVGEETGELDKMLDKIADFYENDVDNIVSRLSSLIEPVMIGVLGVVVGFIVVAVMLPVFSIVTQVM